MAKVQQLVEDASLGYDFSEEEVLFYAQQIGIDVLNEKNLLWIAKEGLSANVPAPWLIFSDEAGRIFYYNPDTHEASWNHPLDKDYASLVSEERTKSFNSVSSDYGFESKLSSLADAPPLSSSGKNTPTLSRLGKSDGNFSGQKIELGRIQNRRSTQHLAPVRLNNKMPTPAKSSGGLSFMPKGSTLTKNIRRTKEEVEYSHPSQHPIEDRLGFEATQDESNESLNSDEGSKYSYEDSEEEENDGHDLEPDELNDASQLSPMRSANGSPNALEISSLVLNARLPAKKVDKKESYMNKENSPSLSLRKTGQPSFLKPMAQTFKKKGSFKGSQNLDPLNNSFKEPKNKSGKMETNNKEKSGSESDAAIKDKIAAINNEQNSMLNEVQNEWLRMQDELEKQEKEKYEKLQKESLRVLEEQERKIRNENSEALLKIQNELAAKVVEEERAAEKSINEIKETNKKKVQEEQKRLEKELESITDSLKDEIKKLEEKKSQELAQKQKELDEAFSAEIKMLEQSHHVKKKSIKEAQLAEIANLQDSHKLSVENVKSEIGNNENPSNNNIENDGSLYKESQEKYQKLLKSIEDESLNHKKLLDEKENILKEITAEKNNLKKIKTEILEAQSSSHELQEEIDKTENDLDLLRSEKSALVSELNILKENIKNEKNNLLNLEKKVQSKFNEKCNTEFVEIGVNTQSHAIDTACKSSQAFVSSNEAFCQVGTLLSVSENSSQTLSHCMEDKSCQTDLLDNLKEKVEPKVAKESVDASKFADDTSKKSLNKMLDTRLSVIEQELRFLQEKLSKPPSQSSQEPAKSQFTDTPLSNADGVNIPPFTLNENQVPLSSLNTSLPPASSHVKCRCELGDAASCNVMQDVKSSIFQMNDILNQHFVAPFRGQNFYQVNPPVPDYSSPVENFYAQVRELQEKQRLVEMKQRCESEFVKLTRSSSSGNSGYSTTRNFIDRKFTNPPYSSVQSNLCSFNDHGDPIHRARNLVLREQAKAWKDQQSFNSSGPHILSSNIASALGSPHSVVAVTAPFSHMSSYQQPFVHFEIDPETDYNNWMTKLNALQHRLRSYKML